MIRSFSLLVLLALTSCSAGTPEQSVNSSEGLCRRWCDKCILPADPSNDCYSTCDDLSETDECAEETKSLMRCWIEKSCFGPEPCAQQKKAVESCGRSQAWRDNHPPTEPTEPYAVVRGVVDFIHGNGERHKRAVDACWTASKCTYFRPIDGKLNLPKHAESCLEEWVPRCQSALDDLEAHVAPAPIRAAYRQWTHEALSCELGQNRLNLEMLQKYGKPLALGRDGDGYQPFGEWAHKRFPKESEAQGELMGKEVKVRLAGANALEAWLTANNVCIENHRCWPQKVERGDVVDYRFLR